MKNNLLEAFNIKQQSDSYDILSDYDIFPDKKLLDALRSKIIENIIAKNINKADITDEYVNKEVEDVISAYDLTNLERNHIFNLLDDEINGYGPITQLLKDDNISTIMVNSPKEIYIEVNGRIIKDESVSFINEDHIIRTINKLIEPLGKTIDNKNPMIDYKLLDGSVINAVIPPLSTNGPVITIRKYKKGFETIDDWIGKGSLTPWMAEFLHAAVKGKLNIIISGASGVGKTTLLNILSNFIDDSQRIITIEDRAELDLSQNNVISLETRKSSYDNVSDIKVADLINNALQMCPDRLIVGEIKGKESFDLLQAINTGHDGTITTIHANSTQESINRLETMILLSGLDIPSKALREYIQSAIDLVIQVECMSDGKTKITKISEVDGFNNDNIRLNDIFIFKQSGLTDNNEVIGEYSLISKKPKVYSKLKHRGIDSIDYMMSNLSNEDKRVDLELSSIEIDMDI